MSIESATEFLTTAATNDELKKHCDSISSNDMTASTDAIAAFAKTKGYEFTGAEALAVMSGELSDNHLGSVSGGVGKSGGSSVYIYTPPSFPRSPRRR